MDLETLILPLKTEDNAFRAGISRVTQLVAGLVDFLGDGGVFIAVAHHVHDALLQSLDFLAQQLGLALVQAHGARAVRAGDGDAAQHFGMALEELRRVDEVFGDVGFGQRRQRGGRSLGSR